MSGKRAAKNAWIVSRHDEDLQQVLRDDMLVQARSKSFKQALNSRH